MMGELGEELHPEDIFTSSDDSNDERCGRIRQLAPVSLAAINEDVLLFPQFVF